MKDQKISLLLTGNSYAFDGIVTALISITNHTKKPLDVYIFTMDLTQENPKWDPLTEKHKNIFEKIVKEANSDSKIILIDVTKAYKDNLAGNLSEQSQYTPFAMIRLLCDKVDGLPEKLLYIDTDIIAMQDIQTLWEEDVENFMFAAVKDYYGRVFINRHYINSGVLLMNLKEMINNEIFKKCREFLFKKKCLFPDQSALNKTCKGRIKYLLRKFNDQKGIHKDTVLKHFSKTIVWIPFHTKNIKPWHVEKLHEEKIYYIDDVIEKYQKIKEDFKKGEKNER